MSAMQPFCWWLKPNTKLHSVTWPSRVDTSHICLFTQSRKLGDKANINTHQSFILRFKKLVAAKNEISINDSSEQNKSFETNPSLSVKKLVRKPKNANPTDLTLEVKLNA